MGELDGKVAIITGAGRLRGIGRACAVSLAKLGCNIVPTGTGRSPDTFPPDEQAVDWRDVESTAEQVREQGTYALPLTGDVTKSADVNRMVAKTIAQFGRVDILINNAAFPRGEDRVTPDKLSEEIFRRVIDIKLVGAFLFSRAVAKHLINQGEGGRIINVSSIGGKRGSPVTGAYATANFGLQGFSQVLAQWLGPYGISCNAVCPGVTDTSRMDDVGYPRDERWKKLESTIPLRRSATDDEIADVISFLCSPKGAYVNGQSLNVCGGMVMW